MLTERGAWCTAEARVGASREQSVMLQDSHQLCRGRAKHTPASPREVDPRSSLGSQAPALAPWRFTDRSPTVVVPFEVPAHVQARENGDAGRGVLCRLWSFSSRRRSPHASRRLRPGCLAHASFALAPRSSTRDALETRSTRYDTTLEINSIATHLCHRVAPTVGATHLFTS